MKQNYGLKSQSSQNTNSSFIIEEGTVAEKTSYVENLNMLIAKINHASVFPQAGSYAQGVKQLQRMLASYRDKKYYDDIDNLFNERIGMKLRQYSLEDKEEWIEQNSDMIAGEIFEICMELMSRSGLSPTGRIASVDNGNI